MGLVAEIVEIYENYQFTTEVLVASRPSPDPHRRSGAHGRRHLHLSGGGDRSMFRHPLTDAGLEKFLKDWEKAQAA